ncbi:type II secretion system major pseudopilin GspG [Maricaulis sp.]|uniref:type II secretion system major pseudopilin GspG n=1 Tax=Maricaulis sp. TaxID=1486257 RepID=UPI0026092F18|nr:type II secretion system major pseudopilin GspG [Maricaulis sp.]
MTTQEQNHTSARPDATDKEAGLSLLEVLVTITIIGIFGTIVLLNVLPAQEQAMVQKARTDLATLEQAIDAYRLDMRRYPTTEQGLDALVTAPRDDAANYRPGGYLRRLEDDPWGNPYQYAYPGRDGRVFDIWSLGADGREGGEDLDADIGNWDR